MVGTARECRAADKERKAVLTQNWERINAHVAFSFRGTRPDSLTFSYTRRRLQGACHEQLRFFEIHIDCRKQAWQFTFTSLRSLPR